MLLALRCYQLPPSGTSSIANPVERCRDVALAAVTPETGQGGGEGDEQFEEIRAN
jgi:hypothetical protein